MEQLEKLKTKKEIAGELHSIVRVMKTLAAVSLKEYKPITEVMAEYNKTIELGLQVVMKQKPYDFLFAKTAVTRLGAVIFGSDQGLCGNFNEEIAKFALTKTKELSKDCDMIAIGEKVCDYLEQAGHICESKFSYPPNTLGITQLISKILTRIDEWSLKQGINKILIFYNKLEPGVVFQPYMQVLLPLDSEWLSNLAQKKWPGKTIPISAMNWDDLFSALIRRQTFYSLFMVFIESIASESNSRLIAMQRAEKNIEERIAELNTSFQRVRQTSITSELIDIVTGYEALLSPKN